jgi:anti-sigma regulatory factor (Ser/Thr protein kinase)
VTTLEAVVASRRTELPRVAALVDELARAERLPPAVVADLQVALDEVLANLIDHGYPDDAVHEIRVRLAADARQVRAEIEDDGHPFDPAAAPPPDRAASLRERRPGGLGLHFVRSLMTEVRYASRAGRNHLVLVRRLGEG